MVGGEYLSFHDVLLKIQGQLELLKRIHLQQVMEGRQDAGSGIVDLLRGKSADPLHSEIGSDRKYGPLCGTSYSYGNRCSPQELSYEDGVGSGGLFLEYRSDRELPTEGIRSTGTNDVKRNRMYSGELYNGERDFDGEKFACFEGETIKMREINDTFLKKRHIRGDIMDIPKSLTVGREESKAIRNFRGSCAEIHYRDQLCMVDNERREGESNQEDCNKTETDERWTDGSDVNLRARVHDRGITKVGDSQSFRRRKRKQESEKIHRTNCYSKLGNATGLFDSSGHNGDQNMRKSSEQVQFSWVRDSLNSPNGIDSKVSSDEELETSSREKSSSVRAGDTEKSEFEASGGRDTACAHSPGSSQSDRNCNNLCNHDSSRRTLEEQGSNRHTVKELQNRLGDLATSSMERDFKGKGFACGTGEFPCVKGEHLLNKDNAIVALEDALAREQEENQKLRTEVTVLKEKLESIMNFGEEGSGKCTYCGSIKENLKSVDLKPESTSCGVEQPKELNNTTKPEKDLDTEVTEVCGSPMESCTNDRMLVGDGSLSFEDDTSLKRKRDSESRSKGKDKKNKLLLDATLVKEGGAVPWKRESDEVTGTCPENVSHGMFDPVQAESGRLLQPLVFEQEPEELGEKFENSGKALTYLQEEEIRIEEIEITEIRKLQEENACTVKCMQDEGQSLGLLCDMQDFPEDLKKLTEKGSYENFVDLKCGCTSQKYGDTVGVLRVYNNGMLEIYCECTAGCEKGKPMTPAAFEKHGGRGASRKWKDSIWVILGDQKVHFSKVKVLDALYRQHKTTNNMRFTLIDSVRHAYHRDEFVRCNKCLKERRFRRRNKEECRMFHDALLNPNWKCTNSPFDRFMSCEDDEEREVRRAIRGCNRIRSCEGCIECVCLGCEICRFSDCCCKICEEFMSFK